MKIKKPTARFLIFVVKALVAIATIWGISHGGLPVWVALLAIAFIIKA